MKARTIVNIVSYCILAAMIITIIALSAAVSNKNKKLKAKKYEIEVLQQRADSLTSLCSQLAKMDAVHCDVTIMVKNTAAFGSIHAGDLNANIEQIATYTRGELLKAMNERKDTNGITR